MPTVPRLFLVREGNKLEYTNPEIPEGINTSQSHPLKEFMWLTGGVVAVIGVLMLLLVLLADFITMYIPFSFEAKISSSIYQHVPEKGSLPDYLQSLAERIALAEELPEGMSVTVHYLDEDTVNAFATLGGHIFLFRGLLEKLPNENALSMLLAHEIAHIKYRHPVRSLGRGVLIGLVLSVISPSSSDTIREGFLNEAGFLTIMKYSRDMEIEADQTAVAALISTYGHLTGADDLFNILQKESGQLELPEYFSTHPLNETRIEDINIYTKNQTTHSISEITPLPKKFKEWLKQKNTQAE